MFTKNTLLTLLVVILFAVSGAVIYFGIFNKSSETAALAGSLESGQANIVNLMPYGEDLDFTAVSGRTNVDPPLVYKEVKSEDIGIQAKDILRNANSSGGSTLNVGL